MFSAVLRVYASRLSFVVSMSLSSQQGGIPISCPEYLHTVDISDNWANIKARTTLRVFSYLARLFCGGRRSCSSLALLAGANPADGWISYLRGFFSNRGSSWCLSWASERDAHALSNIVARYYESCLRELGFRSRVARHLLLGRGALVAEISVCLERWDE